MCTEVADLGGGAPERRSLRLDVEGLGPKSQLSRECGLDWLSNGLDWLIYALIGLFVALTGLFVP